MNFCQALVETLLSIAQLLTMSTDGITTRKGMFLEMVCVHNFLVSLKQEFFRLLNGLKLEVLYYSTVLH